MPADTPSLLALGVAAAGRQQKAAVEKSTHKVTRPVPSKARVRVFRRRQDSRDRRKDVLVERAADGDRRAEPRPKQQKLLVAQPRQQLEVTWVAT